MPTHNEYSGIAALTICEALMLAINDHNILPEGELISVLRDAAATHQNAVGQDDNSVMHQGVADLITRIIDSRNSVRRP